MNEKPRHKYHVVILVALIIAAFLAFTLFTEKKSTPNYDPASLSARLLEVQKNLSEVQKELQSIQNELAKAQKTPTNGEEATD